jgi:hypothetical protein
MSCVSQLLKETCAQLEGDLVIIKVLQGEVGIISKCGVSLVVHHCHNDHDRSIQGIVHDTYDKVEHDLWEGY